VKIHVKFNEDLKKYCQSIQNSDKTYKKTSSFIVLRLPPFVHTCFFNGFVNITGIKNIDQISDAISSLKEHLNSDEILEPIIDTISSSWPKTIHLKKVNLHRIINSALKHPSVLSTKYNRERFPALFIKTNFGTILWFASPAIVAVGSKKLQDLTTLKELIDTIITQIDEEEQEHHVYQNIRRIRKNRRSHYNTRKWN